MVKILVGGCLGDVNTSGITRAAIACKLVDVFVALILHVVQMEGICAHAKPGVPDGDMPPFSYVSLTETRQQGREYSRLARIRSTGIGKAGHPVEHLAPIQQGSSRIAQSAVGGKLLVSGIVILFVEIQATAYSGSDTGIYNRQLPVILVVNLDAPRHYSCA